MPKATAALRTIPPHRPVRDVVASDDLIRAVLVRLDRMPMIQRDVALVRLVELIEQTAGTLVMLGHAKAAAGLRRDLDRIVEDRA